MTLPAAPAVDPTDPAVETLPTALVCAGCGYAAPLGSLALRCPRARPDDDIDHVLARTIDVARVGWPATGAANPFVRYRELFHGYHLARRRGWSDERVVAEIDALDAAVARVDGHGFRITPLEPAPHLGRVLVKDETGNVSGSHKGRHLFGTLLAMRLAGTDDPTRQLAIASCGNAALAAAIVARAAERELLVFVPTDADAAVVERLAQLGAHVTVCGRRPGEAGDPSVLRMREAVDEGALPFTCQGNENGLAVEGGLTLGYELADQLRATGRRLDHLFVQVGGGALASSVMQALAEAKALGAIADLPRMHAVQTLNAHPLARAYERVRSAIAEGETGPDLAAAARRRSEFMWPWTPAPYSIASGILDDETYDWLAVVRGMLASGGQPVLVDEGELLDANRIGRAATGIDVDVTGSAGLAGLLRLRYSGGVSPDETCAVLFTGIRRAGGTS